MCVTMPNFIKIGRTVAEYGDLTVFFQNGGRPPSWICWAPIGTTHDDHLVVSIVVQNLVEIDALVSITLYNSIVPPGLCTGTVCSASQETVQALFPLQMTSPEHQVT